MLLRSLQGQRDMADWRFVETSDVPLAGVPANISAGELTQPQESQFGVVNPLICCVLRMPWVPCPLGQVTALSADLGIA